MKLTLDSMPRLREIAKHRVDERFNQLALANLHADHLHHARRLSGLTDDPHPIEQRESARSALMAAIASTPTPTALDAVLVASEIAPISGASK